MKLIAKFLFKTLAISFTLIVSSCSSLEDSALEEQILGEWQMVSRNDAYQSFKFHKNGTLVLSDSIVDNDGLKKADLVYSWDIKKNLLILSNSKDKFIFRVSLTDHKLKLILHNPLIKKSEEIFTLKKHS